MNIITDLLKEFLGNGSVNMVNVQQWKMCVSGRMLLPLLGNSAPLKTLARNHVICSLCSLPYVTIELYFLCMVRAKSI
jgi:hypothetical protein